VQLDALQAADLPASYPSNTRLSALNFGGDEDLKKQFQLNCAFCHQQGSVFMRAERSSEEWLKIIQHLAGYGAQKRISKPWQICSAVSMPT
jgi:virginiamycin B lyase